MISKKVNYLCLALLILSGGASAQIKSIPTNEVKDNGVNIKLDSSAFKFQNPKTDIERGTSSIQGGFPRIAIDQAVNPENYIVGVGDQLILLTSGKFESERILTVGPEGKVILPEIGDFSVIKQTLKQVRERIVKIMQEHYPHSKFQLLLAQPRSFKIFVLGEANNPGVYISSALNRVSDAIADAGGIKQSGTKRKVEIRRSGKVIYCDLYKFVNMGDLAENPYLLEQDIVFVPFSQPRVTIGGGIVKPDIYELEKDESLRQLILRAGGLNAQASYDNDVRIVRVTNKGQKKVIEVNLNEVMQDRQDKIELNDGDTIHIPSGTAIPANETYVYLSGEVKKPGAYPFVPGYTAKSYIGIAGGLTVRARYSQAEIIKPDGSKVPLRDDSVLELGDTVNIPEKFIKVWQDCLVITTSISSLTLAVIAAFK